MAKRWFLVGGIMLLLALLMAGCGVAQEQYDTVVAERDSAQAELQSAKDELSAAQSTIQAQRQAITKAKTEAEMLNALFVPIFKGEEGEIDYLDLLFEWWDKIEATGDPVLKLKFEAVMDSEGGDEETTDFFIYLFEDIPKTLE